MTKIDLRIYYERESIKAPPYELNIGDLDSEDYDRELYLQKQIDREGFPIETQNWNRTEAEEEDEEDEEPYPIFMFEIDGESWM